MQKTKKQLLGFAGLAAVGIMTAVAYAMPAAAAEDVPRGSGDVNVQVQVYDSKGMAKIISPSDRSVFVEPNVPITYQYEGVTKVETYIGDKLIDTFVPESDQAVGTHTIDFSVLSISDEEADYTVKTVATSVYGTTREDIVTFSYRAVSAEFKKTPASNGDPIIDIEVNSEVAQVAVNVYNKAGDPLFVDKDGKEVPIILSRDDIDPVTGKITKILPFADYNAANGPYTAVVIARNAAGNYISMVTLDTVYTLVKPVDPNLPDTPNTGFTIGDLNISRVDYLITGLIVFGVVSMFALYLVYRKSRR